MKFSIRLLSLLSSLVLVLVSISLPVFSKEAITDELADNIADSLDDTNISETTEETFERYLSEQINNDDSSIGDSNEINMDSEIINDLLATTSTSTSQRITTVPEGIYAFQNMSTGDYMSVENNSTTEGSYVVQSQYTIPPSNNNNQSGLFEITKHSSGETYIIRYMLSPTLTIKYDGNRIITDEISASDDEVDITQTFYITFRINGFNIRQYGQTSYINSQVTTDYLTQGSNMGDAAIWSPRGYRTFIEDGVYALDNVDTRLWMNIENNSCVYMSNLQQQNYSQSPAATFSRGGLFKIKQIGNTGRYTIRLMTNNNLTLNSLNGELKSYPAAFLDTEVPTNLTYYIVFDGTGFYLFNRALGKLIASPDSAATSNNLSLIPKTELDDQARWYFYKYTGEIRHGIDIIVPDEVNSKGAIEGNEYIIQPVVWHTFPGINTYGLQFSTNSDFNVANITPKSSNQTLNLAIYNPGYISINVSIQIVVDNLPTTVANSNFSYNAVPQEGTYYIQNHYSEKYANVLGPSSNEGQIIHQWEFHTAPQAKWQIQHVSDSGGYVRIKSLYSSKYLGVDPTDSTKIRQYSTAGDNTLWRFELQDHLSVKLICKASESSGIVLATPENLNGNGEWLTQRAYTDDSNYSDEWFMLNITGSDVFLLGIWESDRDRYSALGKIMTPLKKLGYNDFNYTITNYIECSVALNHIAESKIFVSRSHGGARENYSCIQLYSAGDPSWLHSFDIYDFDNNIVVTDLSNCQLLIFVGCYTGYNQYSLPYASVFAGADVAIGFKDSIYVDTANYWTQTFFKHLEKGESIRNAALYAADGYNCSQEDIGSFVIVPE